MDVVEVMLQQFSLCLIWGSTWYFIKISLNAGVPPFFGVGFRFFLSGLLFFLIIFCALKISSLLPNLFLIYILFKLFIIPLLKNKKINIFKKIKYKIHTLLLTGFLLDLGRIIGILMSLFKNNKVFNHYKTK